MSIPTDGTGSHVDIDTLDELVGQMVWAFVTSREDLESAVRTAQEGRLAGVWLLSSEMRSPRETVTTVNSLQSVSRCPLLIGVDAEAGMGLVLGGTTLLPNAMAIGATGDTSMARQVGEVTAAEAAACGINVVAAPVLDINVNPLNPIINTRSFGGDLQFVAEMGLAFIEGMSQGSRSGSVVLPIGKHFPGHGDTQMDSHLFLDTVSRPRPGLEQIELVPFRAAIGAGVPMLMTAHVAYPALDPEPGIPATLSRAILTELLRQEMGFQSVVVTDCMNMHAVSKNFEPGEAVVRSLVAGCDLILTHRWEQTHEEIVRAVHNGTVPKACVLQAAGRVRTVKERIFGTELATPPMLDLEGVDNAVGTADHTGVAERIASASITLVDGALIPPSPCPLIMATHMEREFDQPVADQLRDALSSIGWENVTILMLDPRPDQAQVAEAITYASTAGWVALLHFNRVKSYNPQAATVNAALIDLAAAVAGTGVPLMTVSMGSPYALARFSHGGARLCSYSTSDASLRATLRVLQGTARPTGRLPVALAPV